MKRSKTDTQDQEQLLYDKEEVTKVAEELSDSQEDSLMYPKSIDPSCTFNTGFTLLNLALSNNIDAGFIKGNIVRLQGDSGSGKSALAVELLYRAALQDKDQKYSILYKDYENGLHINLAQRYKDLSSRIKIEKMEDTLETPTIEGEFDQIKLACTEGNKTVRVVDSLDCLRSFKDKLIREERSMFIRKGDFQKANECNGMMENGKAYSEGYSAVMHPVANSQSLLILISQLRDTPNPRIKGGAANNTSGGRSTKFYSSYTLALSEKEPWKIKTSFNTEEVVGSRIDIKFLKNRGTGYRGVIPLYLHKDIGFLDQYSVFEWLVERNVIKNNGGYYRADWLGTEESFRKSTVLKRMMKEPDYFQLFRNKCQEVWDKIQEESSDIF